MTANQLFSSEFQCIKYITISFQNETSFDRDLNENITVVHMYVEPKSTDLRQDPVYSKVKKNFKVIFYTLDFDRLKNNIYKKNTSTVKF